MRAAVALTTTAFLAAGGTAAFTLESASAASTDETPPADPAPPVPDGNSPGTGDDAYKADDPFVDHGGVPTNIPKGTVVAQSFGFFPTKITVAPRQGITFDNRDIAIHNIQTLKGKVKVKSPDASPGAKVKFKAPKKAGKYEVGCYYHQAMIMDLVVKPATAAKTATAKKPAAKKPAAKP